MSTQKIFTAHRKRERNPKTWNKNKIKYSPTSNFTPKPFTEDKINVQTTSVNLTGTKKDSNRFQRIKSKDATLHSSGCLKCLWHLLH